MKRQAALLVILLRSTNATSASECFETVSLQSKNFKLLSTYITSGESEGRAVRGGDGYIWTGTLSGVLRRLDPSQSNRVVSEKNLQDGIRNALTLFGAEQKKKIAVGTSDGYRCYGPDGREIASKNGLGATLSRPPIAYGNSLIFVADDGQPYSLDGDCKALKKITELMLPGSLTSAPALFKNPKPVLIYGSQVVGNPITREFKYRVAFASLDGSMRSDNLSDIEGLEKGEKVTLPPAVALEVTPESTKEVALIMTDKGKLLRASYNSLDRNPPKDFRCLPKTPIQALANGLFSTVCVDRTDNTTRSLIFSASGTEISREKISSFNGAPVAATPTSEATFFFDENIKRQVAVMGFSDKTVKVVDIQTGAILDSFQTTGVVKAASYLGNSEFFFSEEPRSGSDELTSSYLVKLQKPPIPTNKTQQARVPCPAGRNADYPHG